MNPVLSTIFLVLIIVAAIAIALNIGSPTIAMTRDAAELKEMQASLKTIDNTIQQINDEGYGSTRIINVFLPDLLTISSSDEIYFRKESSLEIIDYLSRKLTGNILLISEEAQCHEDEDTITMENQFLRIVFNRTEGPQSEIDTKTAILSLTQKTTNRTIYPSDSSIMINEDPSSSSGSGYSKTLQSGNHPFCTVLFHIESNVTYDVYYELYSGADFFTIEVRNIV